LRPCACDSTNTSSCTLRSYFFSSRRTLVSSSILSRLWVCFMRVVWARSFSRYPCRVASVLARFTLISRLTFPRACTETLMPFSCTTRASSRRVSCSFLARSCSCNSSTVVAATVAEGGGEDVCKSKCGGQPP
jgi:hypothetical protein